MDKETKELFIKAEAIMKGGHGFVLVGEVNKKNAVSGGLIDNNVSQAMIAMALANGLSMSPLQLGMYLMKASLGIDEDKPSKKKVAKKKAVTKKKAK